MSRARDSIHTKQPSAVVWFKVYAGVLALVYVVVCVVGIFLILKADEIANPNAGYHSNQPTSQEEAMLMGMIYLVLGIVLGAAFVISLISGRSKASWVFRLVLICLGMTSFCCLPITIPLLIFWLKDDVKQWHYV